MCNLLTHSQKNFATFVFLEQSGAKSRKSRLRIRVRSLRSVLSRNTDVVRRRNYLQACLMLILPRVQTTTRVSGCEHDVRDEKLNERYQPQYGDAAPRQTRA